MYKKSWPLCGGAAQVLAACLIPTVRVGQFGLSRNAARCQDPELQYLHKPGGFAYDAAGNETSDGVNSYSYDAEGNLTQQGATAFVYNALNQQVRQTYSSTQASEVVFGANGQLASLWWAGGAQIMGKAYWGGMPLESYQVSANAAYYQHFDWNLNKRLTTNYAGAVYGEQAELPFGDAFRNVSGSRDNTFDDYAGLWDNGSYMHAQYREYSDMEGRWMRPDPYQGSYDFTNPQSFNRYAYALDSPLSFIDPAGLTPCPPDVYCIFGWAPYPTPGSGAGAGGDPGIPLIYRGGSHGGAGGGTSSISCTQLAAGQVPSDSSSGAGALNAAQMYFGWLYGFGNTSTDFGPSSPESQEMMSAYGLAANVDSFLNGGPSSGFQNFGLNGLISSGANPTAQFVGSYGWSMSLSGGYLNITLTNATSPYSFFLHAPFLNPNPPIRPSSGWHPMGRVNQIFHISVKCGA